MTSAPSFRQASRPAWKPAARPLLFVSRTMWSTPCARATSTVRSVEPSSMISHSTVSKPVDLAREVGERRRERLLLVEAGDLDDELHARRREYAGVAAVTAARARRRVRGGAVHSRRQYAAGSGAIGRRPASPTVSTSSAPETAARTSAAASDAERRRVASRRSRAAGTGRCCCSSGSARDAVRCVVYPTYPELRLGLHAALGTRAAATASCRASTPTARRPQHPLWVLFGVLLAPLGRGRRPRPRLADAGAASSCWCTRSTGSAARRSRRSSGSSPASILCTRFDFPFLAARGYLDIPFLALVVWAGVLEAERPRRGTAGLPAAARAGPAASGGMAAGPASTGCGCSPARPGASASAARCSSAPRRSIWMATDLVVTGDPLFSQNHTSGLAEELGRNRGHQRGPGARP